ncbi:DNA cytosine methyltransferase [Paraburkholderia dipogonis]|uniref:DNA cytosine methyltransferase n=1 Tax=Paraburkholderia dipogonis TaxID=1211383 RepID=UPI0038B8E95A
MKRDAISLSLDLGSEQLVDNFAGGGGASTGIEMAFGRAVDVAINHDGEALAMHQANHPTTRHYREDVFDIHPGFVTGEQPIGLAWFSPDCKHHSKAKGGKPREQKIRGLAWVTLKWATFQAPRCIALENVEEFQDWGPLDEDGRPIKSEKGRTFRAFIDALTTGLAADHPDVQEIYETLGADFPMQRLHAGLGYRLEFRVLRACDFNVPTIRKRLYVFARRDGLPIVWPAPTHGNPKSEAVRTGKLKPWRTAAECIDWSVPCPSIFERARPLKDATLRRIAKGIMKFVVNAADPFIVKFSENSTGQTVDEPLHTVMAGAPRFGVVEPFLVRTAHSDESPTGVKRWGAGEHAGSEPIPTITASQDFAIVAPTLMHVTHQGSDRNANLDTPMATVTGANRGEQALISAHFTKMRTGSIGSDLGEPLHTVTAGGEQVRPGTGNAMGIVAATLVKQNFGDTPCQDAAAPLHTITTQGNKFGLVSATLIQTGYGEREGQEPRVPGLDKPLGTAVAGGVKHAVVSAFLAKHYGGVVGTGVDVPTGTVTTSDHHSVVTAQLIGCGGRAAQSRPRDVSEPAATITAKADTTVVTSHLLKLRNNQFGQDNREPMPTITAGGGHVGEVRTLLQKYHGADALGIVTINGEQFAIVDIGMRMLTPRELARAQGFPDSYILDPMVERNRETGEIRLAQGTPTSESKGNPRMVRTRKGKSVKPVWIMAPLSKSAQVRMIGNSVCPPVAAAIIRANFAHEEQIAGVAA